MKNCKSTESFCLSMLTIYTMIGPLLIFFSEISKYVQAKSNILSPLTGWPTWIGILWKGLTCLPRWFVLANTGWVGSLRSDIFLQIRFIIFQDCHTKQAAFHLSSPLHIISSLFSPFCLFQSVILHKMLKLGFWKFKLIFLDAVFIGCNIFFLWFWLSVWIDICILTL